MRRILGISCIVLGILCLLASAGFVVYNRMESESARESSQELLEKTQEIIIQNAKTEAVPRQAEENTEPLAAFPMPSVQVDGHDCIGILSIPALELELPVLAGWDYDKLQIAPCQYYGSCYEPNFVIAAHNYESHFGRLSELQADEPIYFIDLSGTVHNYKVYLLETLPPTATEEMLTSGFDLSLYTCTPGGGSRVTVRCIKTQ